jgi:integrase
VKARKFPETIKAGNAAVTIYRNTNPLRPNREDFKLAFYGVDGKRRFRSFATYSEARAEADAILLKAMRGELETIDMAKADVLAYTRAVNALKPFDIAPDQAAEEFVRCLKVLAGAVTPLEACSYYMRKHPRHLPRRTVAEVVNELLAEKQRQGASKPYLADLRYRCGKFAAAFQVPIATANANEIRDFLAALKLSPRSHNNFVRSLITLFEFAKRRGYLPKDHDEMERVDLRKDRDQPIDIFTPDEMARLLAQAAPDVLPILAIGAFGGLRSAEIERLEWREVHLAERFIEVPAAKAKTASRRLAPVPDNLAAWLAPYAGCKGKVWPNGHAYFYESQKTTAARAEVQWKRNALRHSFISYRLALLQNANQVALEAGNSPQMIFAHYRELVRPADALRWFAIGPTRAANLVPMSEVAAAGR